MSTMGLCIRIVTSVFSCRMRALQASEGQHPPGPKGMRPGTVYRSCLWSKVRSGQKRWWCNWAVCVCVCVEKSLFTLSSFWVCPLSQVKYLSSISEYKSSVWETCEGYGGRAPFIMKHAVLSESKDGLSVYEGRRVVSSSADHSWGILEGFRREGELQVGKMEAGRSGWGIWTLWFMELGMVVLGWGWTKQTKGLIASLGGPGVTGSFSLTRGSWIFWWMSRMGQKGELDASQVLWFLFLQPKWKLNVLLTVIFEQLGWAGETTHLVFPVGLCAWGLDQSNGKIVCYYFFVSLAPRSTCTASP